MASWAVNWRRFPRAGGPCYGSSQQRQFVPAPPAAPSPRSLPPRTIAQQPHKRLKTQQGAALPRRGNRHTEQRQQLRGLKLRGGDQRLAFEELTEDRGGGMADCTAASLEPGLGDAVARDQELLAGVSNGSGPFQASLRDALRSLGLWTVA